MTQYKKRKTLNEAILKARRKRRNKKNSLPFAQGSVYRAQGSARSVWNRIPVLMSKGNLKALPKRSNDKTDLSSHVTNRSIKKRKFVKTPYDECLNVPYRDKQKVFLKDGC